MLHIDIQAFLKKGQLLDLDRNTTENVIVNKLGKPDEIEDYGSKGKYLHYSNLRLLLSEGELSGVALFFMNSEASFEVRIDEDVFTINKSTPLTELLHVLNKTGLRWHIPYEHSKLDYLLVEVQSGVKIYYYLENNYLERITKSIL